MSIDESVIQEIDKQAFPFAVVLPDKYTVIAHGMSLRDYFAAQALLAAGSAAVSNGDGMKLDYHLLAAKTYQIADAMLAERAK